MKLQLMVLLASGLTLAACGKTDAGKTADSSAGMNRGGEMNHGGGTDTGHKMAEGSMMSGNKEHDMAMMNRMMVDHLGAADSLYDARFLHMMIPHHEGAVLMAKDALAKSNRPELKKLAESIISSQQKEIDQMKGWLKSWYNLMPETMPGTDMKMMGDMSGMNQMMVTKLGARDANYEDRFIEMMIPHHEGAVMMARDAIGKAQHPELKAFAQKIIADQEKEIGQMTDWRKQWYGR